MPLTEEQRQAIRDEEFFRSEVRKELAGPSGFLERCSAFLETKAGFWLLTTVLAGVTATGFTSLQRSINREDIVQREAAESARRDMETVLKLGPMLTSDKRTQVDVAIVLLDGLASDKALDTRVANQVKALVQSTLASGLKKDASVEEKAQANAIIAYADRARVMTIQRPDAEVPSATQALQSAVSNAIDNTTLPVRIYLQIGSEEDRPKAAAAGEALRKAGLIAPGIELVSAKSAPQQNDLRYCDGKVDANALERVKSAVAAAVTPSPKIVVLDPKLCGKVRFNHFEVWYARHGG
jgi:hypothetical protein